MKLLERMNEERIQDELLGKIHAVEALLSCLEPDEYASRELSERLDALETLARRVASDAGVNEFSDKWGNEFGEVKGLLAACSKDLKTMSPTNSIENKKQASEIAELPQNPQFGSSQVPE